MISLVLGTASHRLGGAALGAEHCMVVGHSLHLQWSGNPADYACGRIFEIFEGQVDDSSSLPMPNGEVG
jgi:hypothetical protein